MRGAKYRSIFIKNNGDRYARKYFRHRSLVGERAAETTLFQFRQNFYRNSTRQKNPAICENTQGQVSCLRAKRVDPPIKYLNTDRTTSFESIVGNFARGNRGRFAKSGMDHLGIEKFVQFAEAFPGKDILAGNTGKILLKEQEKTNLALVPGSKIRCATFGRGGAMALAVPIEDGFTETGSRGNYGFISPRVRDALIQ